MSAVPVSAMGRSAERPPRRLLRPPSSRSRRCAGLPVSACGLRLGHALPVTLLQPRPLSSSRLARTALRASSWQPVVVPAGELDEGLPGRSGPSSLSGCEVCPKGYPRRSRSDPGARRGHHSQLRLTNASGRRPLVERGWQHHLMGFGSGDKFGMYSREGIKWRLCPFDILRKSGGSSAAFPVAPCPLRDQAPKQKSFDWMAGGGPTSDA